MRRVAVVGAVAGLLVVAGCAARRGSSPGPESSTTPVTAGSWTVVSPPCARAGEWGACPVDGYPDRPYDVRLPAGYDPTVAAPVVIVLHGGGGSAIDAETMTCPDGDRDGADCLQALGDDEGFITVFPNGSGFPPLRRLRTWNAGGGKDGWNCTSGRACAEGIDDMAYLDAVVDDLGDRFHVDRGRLYAVGLSNGAALAHRLACERAGTVAAIVAVAGSNQYSTTATCAPSEPVAVMQVHGTDDPCWTYETSGRACIDRTGRKLGAVESVEGWAERLGCTSETTSRFPDPVDDGTSTSARTWTGCDGGAEVVLATVVGGGHTWPDGDPALSERVVGATTRDWGNEVVWAFLARFAVDR